MEITISVKLSDEESSKLIDVLVLLAKAKESQSMMNALKGISKTE
jgi:hypothetical protein